ncbi:uncharacterized protein LOC129921444 [Episyrphus balteatus]|uniref:uncharacterized protein LOC129921444 n=1 Tax=Episyrphus balteatus TaxID=286459 RepID=UPI002485C2B1|nr:uncharacterized protein LOC129921444 [Episyrphus balteatus]
MSRNNPQLNKTQVMENFNLIKPQSEMHHQFQNPIIKKPPVTRSKRMEQFLWHEFYEEYILSKENSNSLQSDGKPITTEYIDEYGKLVDTNLLVKKNNDMEIMEELLKNRFPLYSDAAITFWNPKGNVSRNFGKTLSITLPISEQHGQFG